MELKLKKSFMMNKEEIDKHIESILKVPLMYCSTINSLDDVLYHLNVVRGTTVEYQKLCRQKFKREVSYSEAAAVVLYTEIEKELKDKINT